MIFKKKKKKKLYITILIGRHIKVEFIKKKNTIKKKKKNSQIDKL